MSPDYTREIKSDRAIEPLIQMVEDTSADSHVRYRAALALSRTSPAKAVVPLVRMLEETTTRSYLR
jgi:HEAT repeat protein